MEFKILYGIKTVSEATSPEFKILMTSASINTTEFLAENIQQQSASIQEKEKRGIAWINPFLADSKTDSKKLRKIGEIVKIQRIVRKCRKLADSFENNSSKGSNKRTKLLKRTLTDNSSIPGESRSGGVPKGYLAICVGKDTRRFIIPTEYLFHEAFKMLLGEAEEEFGFQQEGVLSHERVVEDTLRVIQKKPSVMLKHQFGAAEADGNNGSCSLGSQLSQAHHQAQIQPCR